MVHFTETLSVHSPIIGMHTHTHPNPHVHTKAYSGQTDQKSGWLSVLATSGHTHARARMTQSDTHTHTHTLLKRNVPNQP